MCMFSNYVYDCDINIIVVTLPDGVIILTHMGVVISLTRLCGVT